MQEVIRDSGKLSKINPLRYGKEFSQALIGAPLGKFRLTIKAVGQRQHTELFGELFDITDRFLNPHLVARFKRLISDEICTTHNFTDDTEIYESVEHSEELTDDLVAAKFGQKLASLNFAKNSLPDVLKAFKALPLPKICRMLLLDEGYTGDKHIIVQFGRLGSMTEYATTPSFLDAGIIKNQDVMFAAQGWGVSSQIWRRLPDGLGRGLIHWIIPDDLQQNSEAALSVLEQATDIANNIAPYIRQEVFIDDLKRAKDAQIKTLDDSLAESTNIVKAKSVENDLLRMTIARLQRHGGKFEPIGKHDLTDFICYALPTTGLMIIGYMVTSPSIVGGLFGVFGGLVVGAWACNRRK